MLLLTVLVSHGILLVIVIARGYPIIMVSEKNVLPSAKAIKSED
jgi:hypothetical protein